MCCFKNKTRCRLRAVRPQFMFRSRLVKASDESFIVSERCRRENKIGALSTLKNTSYRTTEAMAGVVALDISNDSYAWSRKTGILYRILSFPTFVFPKHFYVAVMLSFSCYVYLQ